MNQTTAPEIQDQIKKLSRGVAEIISSQELAEKLEKSQKTGVPLKIKLGIDPTAPHIHLGFAVVLRKMRQFQDMGHRVQLVIGDFTARVGDPSGKSATRKVLTAEEVNENARSYREQLSIILDPEKTDVHFNAQWLEPMNFADIINLASKYTVAQIMERDDFSNRFREGKPISLHEIMYPLMQGYDSVMLKSDVEMGGTDQKFNNLVGRELQKQWGLEPQIVFLMPILEGLDGVRKMSKSYGNYVGITEAPSEMFGKLMSIPDELIKRYLELCTDMPMEEIESMENRMKSGILNPRDAKMTMAVEIISIYHDRPKAETAREEFIKVFSQKEIPADMPILEIHRENIENGKISVISLLILGKLAVSKREARRLIEQGAVKIDGVKIESPNEEIIPENEKILQVGSRKFLKIAPPFKMGEHESRM